MSILQALQDFLEGYEGMELRPLGEILTDLTRAAPPSYSLAPAHSRAKKWYRLV